jgi:hypothetical protein
MVEVHCRIEGEFNRERAYQSARGKSENATEQAIGYRKIRPNATPIIAEEVVISPSSAARITSFIDKSSRSRGSFELGN